MGVFVGSFSAGVVGSLIDAAVSACENEKWDEFLDDSKLKISSSSSNSSQILAQKLEASSGQPDSSAAAIGDPSNSLTVEENPGTDIISSPNGSSSGSTSASVKQQQTTENSEANLSENSKDVALENAEANLSENSKDVALENATDLDVQKSCGEDQSGKEVWLQSAAEKDEQPSPCYERVCTEFYELPEVSAPEPAAELSSIDEQLSTEGFNFNQDMYLNDWRSGWNGGDFPDWEVQEPLPPSSAPPHVHQLTSNSCLTTDRSLVHTMTREIPCQQDHDTMWHLSLVQARTDEPSELARLNSVEVDSMAKCEIPTDGAANFSSVFSHCPFSSSMIAIENPMSFNSTITIPLVSFKSRNGAYLEPQGSIVGFNSLNGSQEGNYAQGFCRKASMSSIAGAKPISRPGTPAATTRAARKSRMARKRRSMVQNPGRPGGSWSSQSPSRRSLSNIQSQQDNANTPEGSRVSISEKNLKFLLQKQLKPSDVGNLGRIVLPKKDAESRLPSLTAREGMTIVMEDLMTSREWHLRYRFWPNNKSRMYLLENTGEFVKSHRLEEGDYMILYKDSLTAKYVICGKKASRMCGPGGMYLPSPDRTGCESTSRAYGPSSSQGSETRSKKMKSLCESAPFDLSKTQGIKTKASTKEAHTNTFSGESSGSKPKRQKVDKLTTISETEPDREVDDDSCLMQFKDDPLMEGIAKDFPAEFDGSELAQFPIIEPVDMAIEEMFSLVDMPTPESKSNKPCLSVS